MKRKIYIDWQKLINNTYNIDYYDLLVVYDWLLSISKHVWRQCGWNRSGFHQTFHDYSANNHTSEIYKLGENYREIIHGGLVNILCKTDNPNYIFDFLKKERIELGKKRIIIIDEETDKETDEIKVNDKIDFLTTAYKGLELKKEFFHPNYEGRLKPRIIDNAYFGSVGNGYVIRFTFSFECFDYQPGWEYAIYQNKSESLRSFFNRAIKEINNLLVESNSCDNCPFWTSHPHHGDYLRHGYRGLCRLREKCHKENAVKYKWWCDDGIHDNAIHPSIVFPYYRNRQPVEATIKTNTMATTYK